MGIVITSDQILLIARLILGTIFIYHGWPKIKDLNANAKNTSKMGFKPGMFWGVILAITEFAGGIFIIIGFLAEIAASLILFQMLVGTFWKLKLKLNYKAWTYDLALFALALVLMRFGPGAFAINRVVLGILRWDLVIVAIIIALFLASLPEVFGKRYQKWKA